MDAQPVPDTALGDIPKHIRHSIDVSSALQDLSPERLNRQPALHVSTLSTAPSSPAPSLGSPFKTHLFQDPFLSSRRGSDVQGKVAQFNNLSRSQSQKRQELEKALERARLGREQAEADNVVLKERIDEFVERERRVGLRLEETMEENESLQTELNKKQDKYDRAKELIRERHEQYKKQLEKAELRVMSHKLNAQEVLATHRKRINDLEEQLQSSQETCSRMTEESQATQLKLIEMNEQLVRIQQQVKLVEEERNALKTSLKFEEVARIAAEGRIPLPISETIDEFSSPKKRRESQIPTPKRPLSRAAMSDQDAKRDQEIASLKRQLEIESLSRKSAEDLVNFMQLECQLKRCSCRLADQHGTEYVCDNHFEDSIADMQAQYEAVHQDLQFGQASASNLMAEPEFPQQTPSLIDLDDEVEFSPETGTFRTVKSPQKPTVQDDLFLVDSDEASLDKTMIAPTVTATTPEQATPTFSDTRDQSHSAIDVCQVIPLNPTMQHQTIETHNEAENEEEETPATPKAYQPRMSDADLLSFTPFILPAVQTARPQPNHSFNQTYTTVQERRRQEALPQARHHEMPVQAPSTSVAHHQPARQYQTSEQPNPQHSSSYPPPSHKSASLLDDTQSEARLHSSHSFPPRATYKIQTITTTTSIPLADEASTPITSHTPSSYLSSNVSTPGSQVSSQADYSADASQTAPHSKSREEALAEIRQRRRAIAETQQAQAQAMSSKDSNAKLSNTDDRQPSKQRSRSVVLAATPAKRRVIGASDRDVSAPMRL